jgi:DNA-binding NtrC family response regulator
MWHRADRECPGTACADAATGDPRSIGWCRGLVRPLHQLLLVPKILIVDDDKNVAGVLTDILEQTSRDYLVTTSPDATRALDTVKRERPDVVLLDVEMPGMDGVDALQHIKTMDGSIPVIMITGSHYSRAAEALRRGALAYIPKPFDFKYIQHLVEVALSRSRTRSG